MGEIGNNGKVSWQDFYKEMKDWRQGTHEAIKDVKDSVCKKIDDLGKTIGKCQESHDGEIQNLCTRVTKIETEEKTKIRQKGFRLRSWHIFVPLIVAVFTSLTSVGLAVFKRMPPSNDYELIPPTVYSSSQALDECKRQGWNLVKGNPGILVFKGTQLMGDGTDTIEAVNNAMRGNSGYYIPPWERSNN